MYEYHFYIFHFFFSSLEQVGALSSGSTNQDKGWILWFYPNYTYTYEEISSILDWSPEEHDNRIGDISPTCKSKMELYSSPLIPAERLRG